MVCGERGYGDTRRDLALHPHGSRSDGLHAGSDAECGERQLPSGELRADEPRHSLPSVGYLCDLRLSFQHAVRRSN